MAGINLSQSTGERHVDRRKFFDKGIIFSGTFLLLTLIAYGTIYYVSLRTERETVSLQEQIDASGVELKGEKIDRILAFDSRIEAITLNTTNQIDTSSLLSDIEKLVLPSIRLTDYQYNHETGTVVISGITNDFKFLAQQIISFKTDSRYANIYVDKISNTEDGDLSFTLKSGGLTQ